MVNVYEQSNSGIAWKDWVGPILLSWFLWRCHDPDARKLFLKQMSTTMLVRCPDGIVSNRRMDCTDQISKGFEHGWGLTDMKRTENAVRFYTHSVINVLAELFDGCHSVGLHERRYLGVIVGGQWRHRCRPRRGTLYRLNERAAVMPGTEKQYGMRQRRRKCQIIKKWRELKCLVGINLPCIRSSVCYMDNTPFREIWEIAPEGWPAFINRLRPIPKLYAAWLYDAVYLFVGRHDLV